MGKVNLEELVKIHKNNPFLSKSLIASKVKCSLSSAYAYLKVLRENGGFLRKTNRKKRTHKLTEQQKLYVLTFFENLPFLKYIDCIKYLNLNVSEITIKRCLRDFNIKSHRAAKKPFLTLRNKINRLLYAIRLQLGFPNKLWKKVIFSDEKTFKSYPDGITYVHRQRNQRYLAKNLVQRETQSVSKVNVFGVISYNGPNKIFFTSDPFTAIEHLDLLHTNGIVHEIIRRGLIFQQDNAKIHNSLKDFVERFNGNPRISRKFRILDHPAKSPDLNPIENVWGELQRRVNLELKFKTISSQRELEELIERCWQEIPLEFFRKQILSMPSRIKEVFDCDGEATHY